MGKGKVAELAPEFWHDQQLSGSGAHGGWGARPATSRMASPIAVCVGGAAVARASLQGGGRAMGARTMPTLRSTWGMVRGCPTSTFIPILSDIALQFGGRRKSWDADLAKHRRWRQEALAFEKQVKAGKERAEAVRALKSESAPQ
eukprot:829803-Pyramimonas_sp.AAC.1